jgi:hypothetical protein
MLSTMDRGDRHPKQIIRKAPGEQQHWPCTNLAAFTDRALRGR